jgi:hypothetical protein
MAVDVSAQSGDGRASVEAMSDSARSSNRHSKTRRVAACSAGFSQQKVPLFSRGNPAIYKPSIRVVTAM